MLKLLSFCYLREALPAYVLFAIAPLRDCGWLIFMPVEGRDGIFLWALPFPLSPFLALLLIAVLVVTLMSCVPAGLALDDSLVETLLN